MSWEQNRSKEYPKSKMPKPNPVMNSEIVRLYESQEAIADEAAIQEAWIRARAVATEYETQLVTIKELKQCIGQVVMIHEGWALRSTNDGRFTVLAPLDNATNPRSGVYHTRNEKTYTVVLKDSFRESLVAFTLGEEFDRNTAIEICKDWAGPGLLPRGVEWGKPLGTITVDF